MQPRSTYRAGTESAIDHNHLEFVILGVSDTYIDLDITLYVEVICLELWERCGFDIHNCRDQ